MWSPYQFTFRFFDTNYQEHYNIPSCQIAVNHTLTASFILSYLRFHLSTKQHGLFVMLDSAVVDQYSVKQISNMVIFQEGTEEEVLHLFQSLKELVGTFEERLTEVGVKKFLKELIVETAEYPDHRYLLDCFTSTSNEPIEILECTLSLPKKLNDFNIETMTKEGVNFIKTLEEPHLSIFETCLYKGHFIEEGSDYYQYGITVLMQADKQVTKELHRFYVEYFESFFNAHD